MPIDFSLAWVAGMDRLDPDVQGAMRAAWDMASVSGSQSVDLDAVQIGVDVVRSFYDDHRSFLAIRRQMLTMWELLESLCENYDALVGVRILAETITQNMTEAVQKMQDNIAAGVRDIQRTRESNTVMTD